MKLLGKATAIALVFIGLLLVYVDFSGNAYLLKGVSSTYLQGEVSATIDDKRFFDTRIVEAKNSLFTIPKSKDYNLKELNDSTQLALDSSLAIAYMVLHKDSIVQEHYFQGFGERSRTNSFSMAKSVVSMLVQIAIQNGEIPSWDAKVQDYLPELKGEFASDLRLKDLSTMSAGLDWKEDYHSPFDITAKAYYGDQLEELMLNEVTVNQKVGEKYHYQSGATQLLAMCLMKASNSNLSENLSKKLWIPFQANDVAEWHTDKQDGMEIAYCCLNTNAQNFARFGLLFMNQGNWKGKQLIDSSFVHLVQKPAVGSYYSYGFWLDKIAGHEIYYMRGILGQYVAMVPDLDLIMVKLGKRRIYQNPKVHPWEFEVLLRQLIREMDWH